MSFFVTKTLLAVLFLAAGLTAALSMLTLMGRTERRMGVKALRNMHRIAGYVFAALLVVLAVMGLKYLSAAGDTLSTRGVLHWSLAALLLFVLALKLAVVRWFKQFIKFAPVMGMTVITLSLVVVTLSAVFFVVTGGLGRPEEPVAAVAEVETIEPVEAVVEVATEETLIDDVPEETAAAAAAVETPVEYFVREELIEEPPRGDAGEGGEIYGKYCLSCHYDDSTDQKIGPGLAGLLERATIEASGEPISPESVRAQIVTPAGRMPSFEAHLSEKQLDDLVAYLKTL